MIKRIYILKKNNNKYVDAISGVQIIEWPKMCIDIAENIQ